jgi:hypothetical protein
MNNKSFTLIFKFPHTEPKTPIISHMQNSYQVMEDGGEISDEIRLINLLNNSIWIKSEFAKIAFRTIEECYDKYGELLEDGNYRISPIEFFPAWKEIGSLLFELGSILDFFSREVNIAFDLGMSYNKVDFGKVVRKCNKQIPDEPITHKLNEFVASKWYVFFREMRNRITHRLPFVLRGMNDQIFFPDFPEKDELIPSVDKQIDVLDTCREWLHNVLAFLDKSTFIIFSSVAHITTIRKETGENVDLYDYFKTEYGLDLKE